MTVVQTDYSNRYYEVDAAFKTTGTDTPDAVGDDEEITESVRNHPMHTALPGLPPGIECPLGGTPSLGASVLALTGELADEMRRMATEQRMMESRAIVSEMKSQANEMREQARTAFWTNLAGAALSFAAAGISIYGSVRAGKLGSQVAEGISDATAKAQRQASEIQQTLQLYQGISQVGQTAGSTTQSLGQSVSTWYEAAIKEMDATIEGMRASVSQLESLDEALKEVIRKATESQQAIQESMNQTRTRILS